MWNVGLMFPVSERPDLFWGEMEGWGLELGDKRGSWEEWREGKLWLRYIVRKKNE